MFRFVLGSLFFALNTILWCLLMYPAILLKVMTRQRIFTNISVGIAQMWIQCNNIFFQKLYNVNWDVRGNLDLDVHKSYLVSCNHQSWVDIFILQYVLSRKVPFLRFFLKKELIYVPLLGLAWWGLDFPFMHRYSKEYLQKHPEKRGQDLEATKRACEKLKGTSTSILNFLEGTRFTPEKHAQANSSYKNLLPAKVGGVAFVLQSMGSQFDSFVDVTIVYPSGVVSLVQLLSGKLDKVIVHIRKIPIPVALTDAGDSENAAARKQMRAWVENIWKEKDQLIEGIKT